MSRTKRVVLYVRVSTGRQQKKDLSIPDQLNQLREYCRRRGFAVVREYVEEGRTATDDRRPALQAMFQDVLTGEDEVHAILVHSFSRAFRNATDMGLYSRKLDEVGKRLISITQETEDTPIGHFVKMFCGLVDEMNSAENAKHVTRALRENARRGHFNGSTPPYGYKVIDTAIVGHSGFRKVLVLDEDEAATVREMFDLYEGASGLSAIGMKKMAEHLNSKCLYRGSPWSIQKIQRILSDELYTGVYLYGARSEQNSTDSKSNASTGITLDDDDSLPVPVPVPVIIEKERFSRIAVRRAARSPRNTPPLHVAPRSLVTGIVRCGRCGAAMHIATGKSGRYRYLKCNKRNSIANSKCKSRSIPYPPFEKLLLRALAENVLTEHRMKTIFKDCRSHADSLARAQSVERQPIFNAKQATERKLTNLYKLVENEKVRIDDSLGTRIQNLQAELKVLTVKLDSLKVPVSLPANLVNKIDFSSFRSAVMAILEKPDSEDARDFVHLVVEKITVYADEVSVSGPNLGLLEAALKQMRATERSVPSFITNWRRGRDIPQQHA